MSGVPWDFQIGVAMSNVQNRHSNNTSPIVIALFFFLTAKSPADSGGQQVSKHLQSQACTVPKNGGVF